MANNVANVDRVAQGKVGVARTGLAIGRGLPVRSSWLGAQPAPAKLLQATVMQSQPTPLADEVPAFVAAGAAAVAAGPITALAEYNGTLLTANYADDTLSVLARQTPRRAGTVDEVYEPFAVAVAGPRAFVTSVEPAYDTVTVLEGREVAARIPVTGVLRGIAAGSDGRRVFALQATDEGMLLGVIDAETLEMVDVELAAGPHTVPTAVATGPDGRVVFVAAVDDTSGVVLAVKDGRIAGGVPIPSMVRDLVVTHDGSTILVISDDDDFGGVLDFVDAATLQIAGTIELGASASQVALSADGARAYVVTGDHVTVVCTGARRIIDRIEDVTEPASVLESADGLHLHVADNAGRVTTFDVNVTGVTSHDALAQMLDADVIDVAMRELEPASA